MKHTLTLGTFFLGCCLAAFGQTSGSSAGQEYPSQQNQNGTGNSQQDQYGAPQSQGDQTMQASPSSSDTGQMQSSNKTSLQGCLTQSADGNFMIADASGNFQLTGDTARLGKFVGQEVRVDGVQSGQASPGSMAASPSEQGQQQFSVSKVHKISSTCAPKTGTGYNK